MTNIKSDDRRLLYEAYEHTCHAWATYSQVIRDYGPARPFPMLCGTQEQHVPALEALFTRFGMRLPNTRCREPVPHFETFGLAVRAARALERENIDLYERLHAAATDPALRDELRNLQLLASDTHQPALDPRVQHPQRNTSVRSSSTLVGSACPPRTDSRENVKARAVDR